MRLRVTGRTEHETSKKKGTADLTHKESWEQKVEEGGSVRKGADLAEQERATKAMSGPVFWVVALHRGGALLKPSQVCRQRSQEAALEGGRAILHIFTTSMQSHYQERKWRVGVVLEKQLQLKRERQRWEKSNSVCR